MSTPAFADPFRSWADRRRSWWRLRAGESRAPAGESTTSRRERRRFTHGDGILDGSEPQPAPGLFNMPEPVMGHCQEQRVERSAARRLDLDGSRELPNGLLESAGAVQDGAERVQPVVIGARWRRPPRRGGRLANSLRRPLPRGQQAHAISLATRGTSSDASNICRSCRHASL